MKSAALVAPRFITPAVCAAFVALYILLTGAPFAHAATPTNTTLTPKQMQTVQMLLDTYGVPQDKIKAVSMILGGPRLQEGAASSTASSTQWRMDGEHGSSTRPMMPPPPRPGFEGGPQSSAGSVVQFVADYSDAFNQNMAAVASAPFSLSVDSLTNIFVALGVGQ